MSSVFCAFNKGSMIKTVDYINYLLHLDFI